MAASDGPSRLFLDSSFLVALYASEDRMHARAVELLREADRSAARLCTIWDCVGESLTVLRRHFGHRAACALADSVRDLTLVTYDTSHRLEALAEFKRRSRGRRGVSFVDVLCAVVIRRELGGDPALSFDRDFRALGLTVIT
ncbi:MAG: type II toxin-antitoxin system VapC family toxin [Candidatus Binatia bacterium]